MNAAVPVCVLGFVLLFSYLYIISWRSKSAKGKNMPPEAKGAWPLIGHLHMLGGAKSLLHITLGEMADEYGPLFTVWLGTKQTVVVNSREMAKECFTKNDLALSSRPKLLASEHLCYNYAMFGIAPHGPYWREMRKISTLELLSNHRLDLLKHITASEVEVSTKELHELWAQQKDERGQLLVEMKQWFYDLTLNIIGRMVAGKRCYGSGAGSEEARRCQRMLIEVFHMIGTLVVADYVPFLRPFDLFGHEKHMKAVSKELDPILQGWIDEHRQRRTSDSNFGQQEDFIDTLLSVLDGTNLGGYEPDDVNKSTVLDMLGGSDTISVVLTWALSLLLNNPPILQKVQDELKLHVGKDRQVNETDTPKLVYLQAIVKETLRLYPPAPLAAQHLVTEDCTIGGYHVPRGTRLIANLYKIQRDPLVWTKPLEFWPERFLTKHANVDVRGSLHFELIPFGAGRRKCPGISLGLQVVHLTLASFLHAFECSTESGSPVDMTQSSGLTNLKATPLQVLIAPRLSCNLI
ncbi:hypothetical protein Nepgr_018527 [Nepenthes gracilis]|uniref:Cytochrome P450 n=1 Tax=Nepenthes gracilis TaxID=150966 RepID=A0AAD3SV69_NEPGR|nr:hypothetical protein Nepgr_018527 [Nepenthes gracilis]